MQRTDFIPSNEQQGTAFGESKQLIAAAGAAFGLAAWLVSSAHAFGWWSSEADFAAACERNQLRHAYANYCIDDRRIVHVLAPDGTTSKPGFDWNVNNAAVVRAEAAVRYAHRSQVREH
ncbi:hypothetical protein GJ654_01660 [Rhodoblastus acidophilus]|uniref:Uncharacterized protein n=1 Tax=Rhodoblastus acidophilus TaxID=1074 RepID=A0A6N8DJL2_RHOAC|nr:hypothetical protein [Rhodoblastus acidophilus]MCW2272784.1 hypothetical protein [Rhodoblastus acidophilus]MTV29695.1 hypothetical protein [Rhodoblastus acidophilus]